MQSSSTQAPKSALPADAVSALQEETVPLKSRIWVSAADAATAMLQTLGVGGGALTYYYTRFRGLDPALAAIIWILFGIWNAVNDPLFGYISDRTKSNLGRRIPYIRFGAPILTISFILFWVVLPGTVNNQTWMFIQMLLVLAVFDALYTAIATSIYVMPYEMAVSNKARSSILIWKIVFSVFPLALPLIIIPIIQPGPGESATNFQIIMTITAIVMGTVVYFSTFFYKEKHFQQAEEQFEFIKSFKAVFTNRSFVVFEVISFTIIYVQTSLMQGVLYYFDEINVPGLPLYVALGVGIVAGMVVFIRMRERWGIKFSTRLMCLVFAMGCVLVLAFGTFVIPTTIGFFCFGIGFAGGMYLIPLMNGDVVDMDENRTGLRREGMYAGVNSFITKPAISLAQAAFLWIIGMFGYNQSLTKGMQPVSAETGILVAWMLIPALLLFVCAITLAAYPLDGPEWNAIKARLTTQHAEKERKFLESQGIKFNE